MRRWFDLFRKWTDSDDEEHEDDFEAQERLVARYQPEPETEAERCVRLKRRAHRKHMRRQKRR